MLIYFFKVASVVVYFVNKQIIHRQHPDLDIMRSSIRRLNENPTLLTTSILAVFALPFGILLLQFDMISWAQKS
jgi:hypothetical protein